MNFDSDKATKSSDLQLVLATTLLALGIFAMDILVPLGVAGGVPYVAVILLSLRSPHRSFTWVVAWGTSLLTLCGYFFSPSGGPIWMVLANRGLALFAIWVTAFLSLHHKQAKEELRAGKGTIELLRRISLAAAEAPSVEAALQIAVDEVCAFTGWPVGHALGNTEAGLESMKLWHMDDPRRFEELRRVTEDRILLPGEGLGGRVVKLAQPVWIPDISEGARFLRAREAKACGLHGAVAFPVFAVGEVAYVLEFFCEEPTSSDTRSLEIITYIGTQFGNAIERKRTQEAVYRQSKALEQSMDGIAITDLEGQFQFVNSAFARMFGYEYPELLGQSSQLLHTDEQMRDWMHPLIGKTIEVGGYMAEVGHMRKDGSLFTVRVSSSLLRDRKGDPVGFIRIVHDISEERELEAQLRQAQKMESVGRLAGGVAHDFNTILGAIMGNCEILTERVVEHPELQLPVEQIHKSAERGAGLTRQLLVFSRDQVLEPRVLDLNELVDDLVPMLRRLITEDIELRCDFESKLGKVKADPGSLQQVLMNLVVNSSDAMPQGGSFSIETRNVEIGFEARPEGLADLPTGSYVTIAVSDTGHGMDEEIRSQVFDPFFSTKEVGKGTGLGLSMVYGIVKQSGGGITVESSVGGGANFRVYLPRVTGSVALEVEAQRDPVEALSGSETVLLVEDDETFRTVLCHFLQRNGYTVHEAANAEEALGIGESLAGGLHLLVTDVLMPGMTGVELAERLEALNGGLRVLFMSGYSEEVLGDRAGVVAEKSNFLRKPFLSEELFIKIREVLGGSSSS